MNEAALVQFESPAIEPATPGRSGRKASVSQAVHLTRYEVAGDEAAPRSAEQFYLQKQIQAQTLMVVVLEDGEQVEGVIEWYDRHCLKLRGRARTLVYKTAIRYMYKHGENML